MHQKHARYIPKEFRKESPKPVLILGVIVLCFSIFLYWLFTVIMPVVDVELAYQAKKTMTTLFGENTASSLLRPIISLKTGPGSKTPQGAVVIPALFLDEPVIYNVDPNNETQYLTALRKGIAQASATRLPGYGGLGYYFAHSSSPNFARQFNAVFYLLGKLKGGEEVILWHEGVENKYVVTDIKVTNPSDVSFLHATYNQETVVLQTCWPPGTSLNRLLVFATREN